MNESGGLFQKIFFELYESLPRQGPGNRESAERALKLCGALPPAPAILDLGCGVGAQTLYLSELTAGTIIAIDNNAPSVERLKAKIERLGLEHRLTAIEGNMANPGLPAQSFDLVWSEGALYNIGIENALRVCRELLRPGGHLVFTDAVWRCEDPPPEIKLSFEADYPGMGRVQDILLAIENCGYEIRGHFTLPDDAWWTDFYTPMEQRIGEMRILNSGDAEALSILEQLAREPELHRLYSHCYAYEYFVARR